ncbi:hypothetical protein [Mycolicibacterium holsaticum]|jgi:hypothetical protein|uniref:hypothetical protein n=1 Tax=Mycolicibacterium holsaticum TaxID=152142 RepID=UPI0009FE67AD|nr:hypothetical protein [Mycolicibacterium holsaticum]
MTKPDEKGSRDTGSDVPSGGPAERPSGTYQGDESVPGYGSDDKPDFESSFTDEPPRDAGSAVPPYQGRKTSASQTSEHDRGEDNR